MTLYGLSLPFPLALVAVGMLGIHFPHCCEDHVLSKTERSWAHDEFLMTEDFARNLAPH